MKVNLINEGMYRASYIITLLRVLDMQCPNRGSKLIPDLKKEDIAYSVKHSNTILLIESCDEGNGPIPKS